MVTCRELEGHNLVPCLEMRAQYSPTWNVSHKNVGLTDTNGLKPTILNVSSKNVGLTDNDGSKPTILTFRLYLFR